MTTTNQPDTLNSKSLAVSEYWQPVLAALARFAAAERASARHQALYYTGQQPFDDEASEAHKALLDQLVAVQVPR